MTNTRQITPNKRQLNYKYRFELSNLNKILDRVDAIKELYDEIEDGTKNKIGYDDANIDDLIENCSTSLADLSKNIKKSTMKCR